MMKNPMSGFLKIMILGSVLLVLLDIGAIKRVTENIALSAGEVQTINGFDATKLGTNMQNAITKEAIVPAKKASGIDLMMNKHASTIKFLCNTFGVNEDAIKTELRNINNDGTVNELNIARLGTNNYSSFDRGLVEYLFNYIDKNPSLVNNTHVPYNGSSTYVENLIRYFTTVYPEVDYLTVISIGAAESGYYQVKFMLNKNNIYGGMGSGGLIQYKTIEFGTLSYVRYLANNYYSKGLNTPESIGRVYCPSTDASGNRVASPHWLNLVAKAKSHYGGSSNNITPDQLLGWLSLIT